MTADEYREMRKLLGTQGQVAKRLDVDRGTIIRREAGSLPVSQEAALALLQLFEEVPKKPARQKKVA